MATRDDGGQAFPRAGFSYDQHDLADASQDGMTLRDYFAGQVLAAMTYDWVVNETHDRFTAARAYRLADAMLAARRAGDQR